MVVDGIVALSLRERLASAAMLQGLLTAQCAWPAYLSRSERATIEYLPPRWGFDVSALPETRGLRSWPLPAAPLGLRKARRGSSCLNSSIAGPSSAWARWPLVG